ncbi:EAL domain-containing protein [Streptomyces sp. DW26H14]|uniref:EAL domain-containing protein n=1 Tax=Streptomyces sp. DW26H14 TaxID=3435395 RepID=UPI00403D80DB
MSTEGILLDQPRPPGAGNAGLIGQLVLALICASYATGAAMGWGSQELAVIMGDFGLSLAALTAAVSCFLYARGRGRPFRPAWLLFSLSSFMAAGGNAVWGWYEVVLREPVPTPSLADLFFLCFAPPAIVGLLVLAKRPSTKAGWICLALDAWLIGGSLLTLSWSLALAHTARVDGPSVAQSALALAYPLLDIVLVSMVLALHFRHTASRTAVNTVISALALTVLCDGLFTSPLLRADYHSGQLLDAGWFAGSLLLAYAPWGVRHLPDVPRRRPARKPRRLARSIAALAPYLSAAVCTLGILYTAVLGHQVDRVVILTGCTVVLALVVRQGIMLVDHVALTQELAQKENHFRSLVQGSSDVIMIAAPSGVLRYVSPAASGVYGRDAQELEGEELASLIHPADLGKVLHEVRRFLAAPPAREASARVEYRFRSGGGDWLNVESTVNRHEDGLIFNSRDVTERVRLQAQLQHNAEHDPLTDLPNRALFTARVGRALSGRRAGDAGTAVLFIDLDGFKGVNDRLGHQAGDELLIRAARRLQASVRAGDTAARLGGDEFAALILGGDSGGQASRADRERTVQEIAERLRLTLSQPYRVGEDEVRVAASIGVAFAEAGSAPADLMRNADLAMYRAKAAGKNRVELYVPQLRSEAVRGARLAGRVRTALHEGEFTLLHQPVVNLTTGRISAVTAQPRWRAPHGLLFTPAEFLRIADDHDHERTAEFGYRLLDDAVERTAERGRSSGLRSPVVVRLPARRLLDRPPRLDSVEALLGRHRLPAGSLMIELSDADRGVDPDELEQRLRGLRRLGVRIALDGFSSGFSAIHALRRLPLDVLKLDRGLVEGIADSPRLHRITAGLLRIACDLGMYSVADGVDRPDQVLALRNLGCTHGQGAAFAGPLDEQRLRRALGRGHYPVPADSDAGSAYGTAGAQGAPVPPRPAGAQGGHGRGDAAGPLGVPVAAGTQGTGAAGGPLGPPGAVGVCAPSVPGAAAGGLLTGSLSALRSVPLPGDRFPLPPVRSNTETPVPPT